MNTNTIEHADMINRNETTNGVYGDTTIATISPERSKAQTRLGKITERLEREEANLFSLQQKVLTSKGKIKELEADRRAACKEAGVKVTSRTGKPLGRTPASNGSFRRVGPA